MLRLESRGESVRAVQEMLNFLGFREKRRGDGGTLQFLPIEEDGIFGTCTEDAVLDFQSSECLFADGIVGPTTMQALQTAYSRRRLELDAPPADSLRGGVPERFTFERVRADSYEKGYGRFSLRNDVAGDYQAVYSTVHARGGILTSSGGLRGLDASVSRSRSGTSFHYLGRALDLYIYSGMVNPHTDPYVIERNGPLDYRLWLRCSDKDNPNAQLPERRSITHAISYTDRTRGVTVGPDHFLDLTALFGDHGFQPIKPRRRFEEGSSMMGAEWWHFQNERGLVPGVSSFGQELLKVYSETTLNGTLPWRYRDRVFQLDWA